MDFRKDILFSPGKNKLWRYRCDGEIRDEHRFERPDPSREFLGDSLNDRVHMALKAAEQHNATRRDLNLEICQELNDLVGNGVDEEVAVVTH